MRDLLESLHARDLGDDGPVDSLDPGGDGEEVDLAAVGDDAPPARAAAPPSPRNPPPGGPAATVTEYLPLTARMRARGICGVAVQHCDGTRKVYR